MKTRETLTGMSLFAMYALASSVGASDDDLRLDDMDLCHGLRADMEEVSVKRLPKPAPGETVTDSTFGTQITRISAMGFGEVAKPVYSTMQAWNADESHLILYHSGGSDSGHHLYDGENYKHKRRLNINPVDLEQFFWHHRDPDILYYMSGHGEYLGKLMEYNVRTDTNTPLASFDPLCGEKSVPESGNGVMMSPISDDLLGFRCDLKGDQKLGFSYRLSTGKVSTLVIGEGTPYDPWTAPQPSTSGRYFFATEHVLTEDLKSVHYEIDTGQWHSHASLGQLGNGDDALFIASYHESPRGCSGSPDKGIGSLVVHNFDKKSCEVIIGESMGYNYPLSGTHVSAVSYRRPGWALVSTIGYREFEYHSNDKPAPLLFSEINLVNTDPDDRVVCRVAHHRSYGKDSETDQYHPYFGEPHATISPSGTRLLFGSDWYDSGSVDAYVIELPAHNR